MAKKRAAADSLQEPERSLLSENERSGDDHDALTPDQEKAILALMGHSTRKKAAEAIGKSEATLRRWMKLPAFVAAYRDARQDAVSQALLRSQQLAVYAVDTLGHLLRDSAQPGSVRVSACKSVVEFAVRGVELEDLKLRVEALESAAQAEEMEP